MTTRTKESWEASREYAIDRPAWSQAYRVLNPDGKEVCVGTHNECWTYILHHQGQSVMYATEWGGWRIEAIAKLPMTSEPERRA